MPLTPEDAAIHRRNAHRMGPKYWHQFVIGYPWRNYLFFLKDDWRLFIYETRSN